MAKKNTTNQNDIEEKMRVVHQIRLPGFISEEVGLGDVINRTTWYFRIKACSGCENRAAALNKWMRFTK